MLKQSLTRLAAAAALSLSGATATLADGHMDIVDTAVNAGQFNTLVAAVQAAGLVGTLKGDGPYTVFAPTDEAFAALPEGTVESLLLPENKDKLAAILSYHVVPKRIASGQIPRGRTDVKSLNGKARALRVRKNNNGVRVNRARVVAADVHASNGVIHVIDRVLMPRGQ